MMDALTPIDVPSEIVMQVLSLPLPPTSNNLFATEMASGRRFKGPQYVGWIREAGYRLNAQHPRPMAGKVAILIEVEEPKTKIRQDVANREKAVTDLLVSHGIIQGDDQRYVREITMRWASVEGCRITIRSVA